MSLLSVDEEQFVLDDNHWKLFALDKNKSNILSKENVETYLFPLVSVG